MLTGKFFASGCFVAILGVLAGPALAGGIGGNGSCGSLPNNGALKAALKGQVRITASMGANGGLGNNMWGVIVDNSGIVCAVAFSGANFTSQWLGSRAIAAQKANTGNSFSVGTNSSPNGSAFPQGLALSSANLFSAVQPGGSLYGLQHSNPVETEVAYGNQPGVGPIDPPPVNANTFGTAQDPMVGQRIGGINVFGGGLALYKGGVRKLGQVSGSAATPHAPITWSLGERAAVSGWMGWRGWQAFRETLLIRTPSSLISLPILRAETEARARCLHGTGGVGHERRRIRPSAVPQQPDAAGGQYAAGGADTLILTLFGPAMGRSAVRSHRRATQASGSRCLGRPSPPSLASWPAVATRKAGG